MEEEINYLSKILDGIKPEVWYLQCMQDTSVQYLDNIIHLRGIYLSKLFSHKENHAEISEIGCLVSSIYKKPEKAFSAFSPMFSQYFVRAITSIQKTPDKFVDTTIMKYKNGEIKCHEFAYSTFPGLFSYFSTQDFIYSAACFLKQVMAKCNDFYFISELVSAFFLSCTQFYETLWNTLSLHLSHGRIKRDEFRGILSSSLELTTQKLTRQHNEILICFVKKFSFPAISFILTKLFKEPFDEITFATNLFINSSNNKGFKDFLQSLTKESNMEEAATVLSIFYKSKTTLYPSLSELTDKTSVPLILSSIEIGNIFNIYKSYVDVPRNLQPTISRTFDVIRFELFPGMKTNTFSDDFGDEMFGIQIFKPLKVTGNAHVWSKILDDYRTYNISLKQLVKEAIQKFPSEKEFLEYQLIKTYEANYEMLNRASIIMTMLSRLKFLKESINFRFSVMIYNVSFGIMEEIVKKDRENKIRRRIEKAIEFVTANETIPPLLSFEFSCCALDTLTICPASISQTIEDQFVDVLYQWAESGKYTNMGRLTQIAFLISNIHLVTVGKKLRQMIEFINQFDSLFGELLDEKWLDNLIGIIYTYPGIGFFTTFLFFNHFVLTSSIIFDKWEPSYKKHWNHLYFGLMSIARMNKKLFQFVSDPAKCSTLFNILGRHNDTFV